MSNQNVDILEVLENIDRNSRFTPIKKAIAKQFIKDKKVQDVSFDIENEARAVVDGIPVRVVANPIELSIIADCNCKRGLYCEHLLAMLTYVHENKGALQKKFNKTEPVDRITQNVKTRLHQIDSVLRRFFMNEYDKRFLVQTTIDLVEFLDLLLDESLEKTKYKVFLEAYFLLVGNKDQVPFEFFKDSLRSLLEKFVFNGGRKAFAAWEEAYTGYVEEKKTLDLLKSLPVQTRQQACDVIDYMRVIVESNFLNEEDIEVIYQQEPLFSKSIESHLYEAIQYILMLYNKWISEEGFLSYGLMVASQDVRLEALYFYELLTRKRSSEIDDFIQSHNYSTFMSRFWSFYCKEYPSSVDGEDQLVAFYAQKPSPQLFWLIQELLGPEKFVLISDKLLKLTKKQNLQAYYEIQIKLDKEKAFELLLKGNVFDLKDYFHYFPEKEEDILLHVQKECIDIVSKIKSPSKKLIQVLELFDAMASLKNGKYYIFSIVRASWLTPGQQIGVDVYQQLLSYCETLGL